MYILSLFLETILVHSLSQMLTIFMYNISLFLGTVYMYRSSLFHGTIFIYSLSTFRGIILEMNLICGMFMES